MKSGKVKDVYEVSDGELEFVFSDRISVFDKVIPSTIPHKGETLARTSAHWFEVVESLGVKTHYLRLIASNRMRVKRVQVIRDYGLLTPATTGYLIPLECIVRYFVYGSLWDRVQKGTLSARQLGFPRDHTVTLGESLPHPFFEVTTKLEKVDRTLTVDEALKISGLRRAEFEELRSVALRIDEEITARVGQRGLIHVDGKKEFAFDEERNLMVVDAFGTADEDRFWDAEEYAEGRYVERSKEYVRQYYRQTGYHRQLMAARSEGRAEPPIPALPEPIVQEVSEIYIKLYEDLTGQRF
jgi:phosphoribosylaminoimidazole-succinocarboxamide synthase